MNKSEIMACIYKHVGRTDDIENLVELAEEIARMAAEEEREACKAACEACENGDPTDGHDGGVAACGRAIGERSNANSTAGFSPSGAMQS
jgi:hypothetical protein